MNLETVYHGVAKPVRVVRRESTVDSKNSSLITHHSLFEGLPDEFEAGRYHSWIVSDENFPVELEVTARDDNDYIMALQHKNFDVIQFRLRFTFTFMPLIHY